jgi:divalent metal cation (Fe/Co/Zn/Cd) transporter
MLWLSFAKRRTGRELNNPVLVTEAKVTLVDGYLAAAVLAGLVLNAIAGWWWADPVAGLVIVYYGLVEGAHALRESRA